MEQSNGIDCLVYEDDEHRSNLLENLNMLRRNKQFCDVILQIGNQQDIREIYAHRAVLSSVSPYFLEMFSTDSTGPVPSIQNYKLLNGNYEVSAFDFIVEYSYTGKLEIPKEKVKDVYALANRLKMTSLAHRCGNFLVSSLTPDNCLNVRSVRGVLHDPFLLNAVDNYIRQYILEIAESKYLESLPKVQVELLLNNDEERAAINEKHVFNMIIDWIRNSFDYEKLSFAVVTEKLFMLYLNKSDKNLHDCTDIENGGIDDSELIQDYKRLSRRLSFPTKIGVVPSQPPNDSAIPSKPRQFLFTRSDSDSSLSSLAEEDENDWKVLASCSKGNHNYLGLVIITGKLCVLNVKLKVNSPNNSPRGSRNHSIEKLDTYCFVPSMSSARCAVGTSDLDGKLLVCGGYDRGECLKTCEVYDALKNKWEMLKPMKIPRGRFDICVFGGNVFAIGGCDGQNELSSAEMYDSVAMIWKQLPNCPVVRSNAGVCCVNGKIHVIGGWNGQRGVTRCDVFDPESQQWSEIEPLLTGRYQAGVAVLDDIIYTAGGCDSWTCLNSAEMYVNNQWRLISPMQTSRRGCGVAAYNGKIYTVGGHDGVRALCSVEIYDPSKDQWTPGPSLTCCRANVGVTVVGNKLYAVGGFNGKTFLNTIEYLDPESNEWTTSVLKCDIIAENGENGDDSNTENTSVFDLVNDAHPKVGKTSVNDEPLIEVEETIGH